ncbi:MAG: tetratricopeptide repeat protein, partial [Pseudanabaena sp.]
DAYNSVGFLLTEQKQYAEAAKIYRQAIAVAPRNAKIYLNLGYVLKLSGDRKGAFAAYNQADKIAPFDADVLVALGGLFAEQNQYEEAIANFKRALEVDTRHPQANLAMSKVFQSEGNYAEAITSLRRAAGARNIPVNNLIELQRAIADIYIQQGSLSGAIVAYRQILEAEPEDAPTYLALGKLLATQQRAIEARKMLESAERFFNRQGNIDGLAQARKALAELK